MKTFLRVISYISLAAFIGLSVLIQLFALQPSKASASVSNGLTHSILDFLFGSDERETDEEFIPLESIRLSLNTADGSPLTAGNKYLVLHEETPKNATETFTFHSSDESVAAVHMWNGELKAKGEGSAVIWAESDSGKVKSNEIVVEVVKKSSATEGLDFSKFEIVTQGGEPLSELKLYEAAKIGYTYDGEPLPNLGASLEIANGERGVAAIYGAQGCVVAMGVGEATIKLTAEGKTLCERTLTVTRGETVLDPPAELLLGEKPLSLADENSVTLFIGKTYDIDARFASPLAAKSVGVFTEDGVKDVVGTSYGEKMETAQIFGRNAGECKISVKRLADLETLAVINVKVVPPPPTAPELFMPDTLETDTFYTPKLLMSDPNSTIGWNFAVSGGKFELNEEGTKIKFLERGRYTITFTSEFYPDDTFAFSVKVQNKGFSERMRKILGHAALFGMLGFFAATAFGGLIKRKPLIISLVAAGGIINALLSEFFQLPIFGGGRTAAFRDVVIDLSGYIIGALVVLLIYLTVRLIQLKRSRASAESSGS